jgi:hypothetical protein
VVQRCLIDLHVPYERAGDQIVLKDQPRGWRVFACQVGAVSGFRCFGFSADELAKWRSADEFSKPGERSLRFDVSYVGDASGRTPPAGFEAGELDRLPLQALRARRHGRADRVWNPDRGNARSREQFEWARAQRFF